MRIQRCRIERELAEAHWEEFQWLIRDRRARGVEVVAWLRERGYEMSRSGICKYRQKVLCGGTPGAALTETELAAARQRGVDYAGRFEAGKLALFVAFGDFLAGQSSRASAGSIRRGAGVMPAPLDSHPAEPTGRTGEILATEAADGLPAGRAGVGMGFRVGPGSGGRYRANKGDVARMRPWMAKG